MLQLFFAIAFSAVPLTLYVPPIRSLSLFVEAVENLLQQTTIYTLRAYPRIRLGCTRIFNSLFRFTRPKVKTGGFGQILSHLSWVRTRSDIATSSAATTESPMLYPPVF